VVQADGEIKNTAGSNKPDESDSKSDGYVFCLGFPNHRCKNFKAAWGATIMCKTLENIIYPQLFGLHYLFVVYCTISISSPVTCHAPLENGGMSRMSRVRKIGGQVNPVPF
jgi:hypothetical protein